MPDSGVFIARYNRFRVPCCDAPIVKGDEVRYVDDELVHAHHHGAEPVHAHRPLTEAKPAAVCGTCSLVKPCWCD